MLGIGVAILFLTAIGSLAARGTLPPAIPLLYVAASLATGIAYGIDKSAARIGGRRISEQTLHLLSLIGGWPGALIAQQAFRHKSRKASFRLAFWATVGINCAALAWFYWPVAG